MIHPAIRARVRFRTALGAAAAAALGGLSGSPLWAQVSLFEARDLPAERFVLVAAPIGTGERAQLNIYEQVKDTRPCFAVSGASPAQVDPLLGGFDFTGICGRYIDGNGYSLRVGGTDLATVYRLSVIRQNGDTLLLAAPTKAGAGPEMVVARSGGQGSGFLQLVFEPGWKLMRRHFGPRALGHVYVFRDDWPGAPGMVPSQPAAPGVLAAPAVPGAPAVPTTPQQSVPASPASPAASPAVPATPAVPSRPSAPAAPTAPQAPAAPSAPSARPSPSPSPTSSPTSTPAPTPIPSPASTLKPIQPSAAPAAPAKPPATPASAPAPVKAPVPATVPVPSPPVPLPPAGGTAPGSVEPPASNPSAPSPAQPQTKEERRARALARRQAREKAGHTVVGDKVAPSSGVRPAPSPEILKPASLAPGPAAPAIQPSPSTRRL